jgi:hypothetical protein
VVGEPEAIGFDLFNGDKERRRQAEALWDWIREQEAAGSNGAAAGSEESRRGVTPTDYVSTYSRTEEAQDRHGSVPNEKAQEGHHMVPGEEALTEATTSGEAQP